jgi:mannose-6-phosphate isomerase-like protein (cupin superfamily)
MASSTTSAASAAATHGAALTFETIVEAEGAPLRVRPAEDTLLRVIDGIVVLTVGDAERLLEAGDEAVVPAGALHRLASAGGAARFVTGLRPARR